MHAKPLRELDKIGLDGSCFFMQSHILVEELLPNKILQNQNMAKNWPTLLKSEKSSLVTPRSIARIAANTE
jgi:hypothetical protein